MSNTEINILPYEVIMFILVNLTILIIGVLLWYVIWIKNYGGEIPNPQLELESQMTFFSSKNFSMVVKELWKRIRHFDKLYFIRSTGMESYVYLFFLRKICSLLVTMSVFSFLFSFISTWLTYSEDQTYGSLLRKFLLNYSDLTESTTILHLFGLVTFTFLHFRFFSMIKREAKFLYFERFDKFSRHKNADWLSCRTLHISGLAPEERNTSVLHRKIDLFLNKHNGGKVVDILFIPDYKGLLKFERKRQEILDLKDLISKKENSCVRKFFFPKVFRTEETITNELNRIENKMQELTELPVLSSGHAFICFDSLTATTRCLNSFEENTWDSFVLKLKNMWKGVKYKKFFEKKPSSTFGKFDDEEDIEKQMVEIDKVNILVDQMIEPFDIVWRNVGGDRGLNVCRRLLCNILIFCVLVFLTTPMSIYTTIKSFDPLNLLEFDWLTNLPYGNLFMIYMVPFIILSLNILLIFIIDKLSLFENHYTHTRYQLAVFSRSFMYMMLNILIIPGVTLSTAESLFNLIRDRIDNLAGLLSQMYLSKSGYFFISLICQSGTISAVFYLLRLDELFMNSLSPFATFYRRHFINTGHQWHRKEGDCFQFGYYYAQFLVFYTISLVFSSTPIVCPATFYFFVLRYISDSISLLMVHGNEIDSSGRLINTILNYACIPIILYHLCMISFFLVKGQHEAGIVVGVVLILSLLYVCYMNKQDIFNSNALRDKLKVYEHPEQPIPYKEINVWRNKFKHPLVIPIFIDDSMRRDGSKLQNNFVDENFLNNSTTQLQYQNKLEAEC